MNSFIRMEIITQIMNCKTFLESCERGALKDDGVVDRQERKQLARLEKATRNYVKALNKIMKD